ncbi:MULTISPECIES: hypothetical protein [unclassified Pseudomonas]|uniref:hypothetical protein n=1 Tax=unclassified Pseudomonas TaxID=196821 RepID=UPI0030DDB06A
MKSLHGLPCLISASVGAPGKARNLPADVQCIQYLFNLIIPKLGFPLAENGKCDGQLVQCISQYPFRHLKYAHPGCLNVLMPEIATGLDLTQTANKKWIGLAKVSADKAYLLNTPSAKAAKRPYIVKNDVVGVLAFKHGWAQVEFINAQTRSFTGWISQDQYSRLSAPKP